MIPVGSSTDGSCHHGADRQNNLRLYSFTYNLNCRGVAMDPMVDYNVAR